MKTLLITGASSGFGKSLAEEALGRGHQVAMAVRDVTSVADLIERFPDCAAAYPFDLTNKADASRIMTATISRFGHLDVLVNNAGYGLLAAFEETTDDQLERNLETNFTGPYRLMRAVLPLFREQKSGQFINISAIAAYVNHAGFSVYGGAKAALDAASEALAEEVKSFGIRTTLVVPGPFRTEFIGRSLENPPHLASYEGSVGKFGSYLQKINGHQPGDPARAAKAIINLLDAEKPPFRLILGAYANTMYSRKLATLEAEWKEWKELGIPTDFLSGT
jgi:NAD(P)-dependent dehydrogenase (short-subunit alcohol dehydrogenase family)